MLLSHPPEAELSSDPKFQAAIIGDAERESRLAMDNSYPAAEDIVNEGPSLGGTGEEVAHTSFEQAFRLAALYIRAALGRPSSELRTDRGVPCPYGR